MTGDPARRAASARIGWIATLAGTVALVARWGYGFAPDVLVWPVFAVSSVYVERRSFAWITNNVTDELATAVLVLGLATALLARPSRGAVGAGAASRARRRRAVDTAIRVQAAALLLVNAFTYGLAFLAALPWTPAVFPVAYWVAAAGFGGRASEDSAN